MSKQTTDDSINQFFDEYWSMTYENPFNRRERVLNNMAILELTNFNGQVHLSSIRTVEHGKGYASSALKIITALADKHSVILHLTPKAFGYNKLKLNKEQLTRWYERNGFALNKFSGEMIRLPKHWAKLGLNLTSLFK